MSANGMLWISTPRYTVGLIVRDGQVVHGPPIARSWALGRDARALWRSSGTRPGVRRAWLAGPCPH